MTFRQMSRAFQKNRKKNGSSRRWAIKSKRSVRPTSENSVNIKQTLNEPSELLLETRRGSRLERFSSWLGGFLFCAVRNVSQIWTNVWSFFCFWRVCVQRVELLHLRLEALQNELCLLRSNSSSHHGCKCNCRQSDRVKLPPQGQISSVAPPLIPPPPPPPPPPPAPAVKAPEKLLSMPKKKTSLQFVQEKLDGCAVVTVKDLQAVQLRKVSAPKVRSPDGRRSPLITLADLQKIRLRRTQFSFTSPNRRNLGMSQSPMKLHLQLRRVRTSGNTPLCNKENVQ